MVNGLGSQCFLGVMSKVKLRGWCLTKINMVLGWMLGILKNNLTKIFIYYAKQEGPQGPGALT